MIETIVIGGILMVGLHFIELQLERIAKILENIRDGKKYH